MSSSNDLRRLALPKQGTTEHQHFERSAFKVARIYVTLAGDGKSANLLFSPDEQQLRCTVVPDAFTPLPSQWVRQKWTRADLTKLSEADLANALDLAWRHALPKAVRWRKA